MVEASALTQEKVMAVWLWLQHGRGLEMSRFKLHFRISDDWSEVSAIRGSKMKHQMKGK